MILRWKNEILIDALLEMEILYLYLYTIAPPTNHPFIPSKPTFITVVI